MPTAIGIGISPMFQQGAVLNLSKILYDAYIARIAADSGVIESESNSLSVLQQLNAIGLLRNAEILLFGEGGTKQTTSTIYTYGDKWYDASGNDIDAVQATALSKPFISGIIAPNEKLSLLNPQLSARNMAHTAINYLADQVWTLTFCINYNGTHDTDTSIIKTNAAGYQGIIIRLSNGTKFILREQTSNNYVYFDIDNKFIIGKNSIVSLVADGLGNLNLYIEGEWIQSIACETKLQFQGIFEGYPSAGYGMWGKFNWYSINSIKATDAQIKSEHTLIRSLYPKTESVVIGSQEWTTTSCERVVTPMGTIIPNVTDNTAWAALTTPAWCYFNNDPLLGAIYGKLYNWWAVKKIQDDITAYNVLHPGDPEEFELPESTDLTALSTQLGGNAVAGGKLKYAGTTLWNTPNAGADNSSGMTLLGSGYREVNGTFVDAKNYSFLWQHVEAGANNANALYVTYATDDIGFLGCGKKYGFNVRLIKKTTKPILSVTGNVAVIGDSTIDMFQGCYSIAHFLTVSGTVNNLSEPGETIAQQKARFDALTTSVKTALNYVFVQIGLNDLNPLETAAAALLRYQSLIDSINTNAPQAVIIAGTMSPCKQAYIDIQGAELGAICYQKWLDMNDAIKGNGDNAITGIDHVTFAHTTTMNDGSGNLAALYDKGDHVHPNDLGRYTVAASWHSQV